MKLQPAHFLPFLLLLVLSGCIGTDIIDDPRVPPRLTIHPRIDSLPAGDSIQFTTTYTNEIGQEEAQQALWSSTSPADVSIDGQGWARSHTGNSAQIIAFANGAADTLTLNTAGVSNSTAMRTGSFVGVGGYNAAGTATLEPQPDGSLKLLFGTDFVASAGPSLYILLANHTNGNYMVVPGTQSVSATSAQITPERMMNFAGEMEFTVPADVSIVDFDFVVLYCVIGPVFGYAELN
ncbi:MAG: hypothetical protein AAF570_11745 [Bacteroidota bacterium]